MEAVLASQQPRYQLFDLELDSTKQACLIIDVVFSLLHVVLFVKGVKRVKKSLVIDDVML